MSDQNHNHNQSVDVAVFFDYENIVYSVRNNYNINANFEDLMDKCKEFGRVVVARAFADWNRQSPAMIPALISNGFDPVYVPSFQMGNDGHQSIRKNAVDMYMAIDAMDILHNRKNVDTFILLTGDSDFLPLVNAARREGNRVIAIGVDGSSSSHLAQSVDEFIFYSQVSSLPDMPKKPRDIYEGIVQAIKELQKTNKSTVLPNVKLMMNELMGGFDEKKHSDSKGRRFQKFKEFVQDAERRGLVRLITTGTVNEVFLGRKDNKESGAKSGSHSNRSNNTAEKQAKPAQPSVEEAYLLLIKAVYAAQEEDKPTIASAIKNSMVNLEPNFNEKEITVDGQRPFSRFGEFLSSAEKKGYVRLDGKGSQKVITPLKTVDGNDIASDKPTAETKAVEKVEKKAGKPAEETAVATQKPEPKKEKREEQPSASASSDYQSMERTSEQESKQLIIDALRLFDSYPAPFLKIEAFCRQVRNDRKVFLPSPKVRELLTEATRQAGVLKRVSPPGVSPAQYQFDDDGELIGGYLGIPATAVEAQTTPAEPESEPTQPQQPAEQKAEPKAEKPAKQAEPEPITLAFETLAKAVQQAIEQKRSLRISAISKRMRGLAPDFKETNFTNSSGKPFARFIDFAKAAESGGYVSISGSGTSTTISLPES